MQPRTIHPNNNCLTGTLRAVPRSTLAAPPLLTSVPWVSYLSRSCFMLTVLAERPELLRSWTLSSSERRLRGWDTLCCCWGRWGRKNQTGIRLRAISFSWCCLSSSFSKSDIKGKQRNPVYPSQLQSLLLLGSVSAEPHFWILNLHRAVLVQYLKWAPKLSY